MNKSEIAERLKLTADTLPRYGECAEDIGPDDGKVFLRRFIYDNTPAAPDSENIFRHNLAEVLNEYFERVERAIAESRGQPNYQKLLSTVGWIAAQTDLFFAECSQAEEIVARCKEALAGDNQVCICELPDYEGQPKLNGGWDKDCPVHGETENLQQQLTDAKRAYGKLFNENAALQGRIDELNSELGDGEPSSAPPDEWEVYAPEGEFDGRMHPHNHPHTYSICTNDENNHKCIALVFGKTDREASGRASYIVAKCNRSGAAQEVSPSLKGDYYCVHCQTEMSRLDARFHNCKSEAKP